MKYYTKILYMLLTKLFNDDDCTRKTWKKVHPLILTAIRYLEENK